jgi:hypothetical protein
MSMIGRTRRQAIGAFGAIAALPALAARAQSAPTPTDTPRFGAPTVKDFGAKGDGSTDDTAALRRAVAASKTLLVPPGRYMISGAVDLRGPTRYFRGLGAPGEVTFVSTNPNEAILPVGGLFCDIGNFELLYEGEITPRSIAMPVYALARSRLSNLFIDRCFQGLALPQEAGVNSGAANYIYSVSMDTVTIQRYTDAALSLMSYRGGSTGSVFTNLYLNSFDPVAKAHGRARVAVELGGFSELTFNQLNVEHTALDSALQVRSDCFNLLMNAVHLEGYEAASPKAAVFELNGRTSLIMNSLTLETSDFKQARLGGSPAALFRLGPGAQVELNGFQEYRNTVDIADLVLAAGGAGQAGGAAIRVRAGKAEKLQPRAIAGGGGWAPNAIWSAGR